MRMKFGARKAIALLGGVVILVGAVGCGGGGGSLLLGTTATTTAPLSRVMPVSRSAAAPHDLANGCIHRANC